MDLHFFLRTISICVFLFGAIGANAQLQQDGTNVKLDDAVANLTNFLARERQKAGETCPFPFTTIMNQCFYINTYIRLDFDEAREFCKGMGGDLAQPKHPNALRVSIWDWEATKSIYDRSSHLKVGARIPDDWFWQLQNNAYSSIPDSWNMEPQGLKPRNNLTWISGELVEVQQVGTVEGIQGDGSCLCLTLNHTQILPYIPDQCRDKTPFVCEYVK